MNTRGLYKINAKVAWVNEANGTCALIISDDQQRIQLEGLEAILWRSIWQDLATEIWAQAFTKEGNNSDKVLNDWLQKGWIIKVDC
jgi:hypothetical protein